MKLRNIEKVLLISTLILFTIVILYLYITQETNGFHYRIVAAAEATRSAGVFQNPGGDPRSLDFSGYVLIHAILMIVLDINTHTVQILPIGIILVPFIWVTLIKQFSNDIRVIIGFTTLMLFVPSFIFGHFSTFAYTWSRVLYLSALLCIVLFVSRRSTPINRRRILFVLILLTIGLANTYWTSTAWLAINLIVLSFILYITKLRGFSEIFILGLISLVILFMIPTIRDQLVQIFIVQAYDGPLHGLQVFIDTIADLAGITSEDTESQPSLTPSRTEQIASTVWGISRLVRHGVIYISLAILGLLMIKKYLYTDRQLTWSFAIVAMIIITAFIHSSVYLARGNLSLRYASLVFPIAILVLAWELDYLNIVLAVGACLGLISILAFAGYAGVNGFETTAAYDSTQGSGEWVSEYSSDTRVLGDFISIETMRAQSAHYSRPVSRMYFTGPQYDWVVSGGGSKPDIKFTIINENRYDNGIVTRGWGGHFPSFAVHQSSPENLAIYQNESSVYDNGNSRLFYID